MVQTEQEPQNKSQSSVETVSSDRDENYENFPVEDIEEEEEQSQLEYYTLKQPRAKQAGGLKAGEKVLYYSRSSRAWEKVTLTVMEGKNTTSLVHTSGPSQLLISPIHAAVTSSPQPPTTLSAGESSVVQMLRKIFPTAISCTHTQ